MVHCVVIGCNSRAGRDNVSFYSIPAVIQNQCSKTKELSDERRRLWLKRINRKSLTCKDVTPNKKVCDRHFISGRPSPLFDNLSPDWAPSIALGYKMDNEELLDKSADRYFRAKQRHSKKNEQDNENEGRPEDELEMEIEIEAESGVGCQTEISGDTMDATYKMLLDDNIALREEIRELKRKLSLGAVNEESLRKDDAKVKFYTGLPSFLVLHTIFEFVTKGMEFTLNNALQPFEEFLVVLMRLRLDLLEQDLAYRFRVTQQTISNIILRWLPHMADRLRCFIVWPDRESLQTSMPQAFRDAFGKNVAVIIDCFEIFINRPSSLSPRASTWSQYKHHNTVKFLIGITPQGSVSFISKAWPGRTSDKEITEECGILRNLLKGDVVLADRGFNIGDDVAFMYAKLAIPAFTKGKPQLSYEDVESTRKIANVRIQVERVIGLIRNKYHILQDTLPILTLSARNGESDAVIDQMVTVACALVNFCPSIVIDQTERDFKIVTSKTKSQ